MARVNLLYFAWVREKIGRGEETRDIPDDIDTVADLIGWLRQQGDEYESAFARPETIRTAIDQQHVPAATAIVGEF